MTKKLLISLLTLFLLSCSPSTSSSSSSIPSSSSEKENIILSVFTIANEQKTLSLLAEDFNQQNDEYNICLDYLDFSYQLAEDNLGDFFLSNYTQIKDYLNFTEINNSYELIANFDEKAIEAFTFNNNFYGYPFDSSSGGSCIYYNDKFLSSTEISSFENILEKALALNKKVYFDLAYGAYNCMFFMTNEGLGTDSINYYQDGNDIKYNVTWDNSVGVEIARTINDLFAPYVEAGILANSSTGVKNDFDNENVIAFISFLYYEETLPSYLKAAKLPTFNVGDVKHNPTSNVGSVRGYFINNQSNKKEIAKEFLEYLSSVEGQIKRFEIDNTIPTNKNALNDNRYKDNATSAMNAVLKQKEFAVNFSLHVEDKYYSTGVATNIGQALFYGLPNEYLSWENFLTDNMNLLR